MVRFVVRSCVGLVKTKSFLARSGTAKWSVAVQCCKVGFDVPKDKKAYLKIEERMLPTAWKEPTTTRGAFDVH